MGQVLFISKKNFHDFYTFLYSLYVSASFSLTTPVPSHPCLLSLHSCLLSLPHGLLSLPLGLLSLHPYLPSPPCLLSIHICLPFLNPCLLSLHPCILSVQASLLSVHPYLLVRHPYLPYIYFYSSFTLAFSPYISDYYFAPVFLPSYHCLLSLQHYLLCLHPC